MSQNLENDNRNVAVLDKTRELKFFERLSNQQSGDGFFRVHLPGRR